MSTTYAQNRRDHAIANEAAEGFEADAKMRCIATNCPNRSTVDAGSGRLCSAHAWADPKQWPSITREQNAREADRAMFGASRQKPSRTVSKVEALEKLASLRIGVQADPLAWAWRLKARDERGDNLTAAQREMYRRALRLDGQLPRHEARTDGVEA